MFFYDYRIGLNYYPLGLLYWHVAFFSFQFCESFPLIRYRNFAIPLIRFLLLSVCITFIYREDHHLYDCMLICRSTSIKIIILNEFWLYRERERERALIPGYDE